jgi:hypothetical protein
VSNDDFYLVRTLGGLKAADDRTEDAIKNFGLGEIVRVKFYSSRNIRHHRLFFGLLNMVFVNQDKYLSLEGLRFAVTIQAGYVDEIKLAGDKVTLKPKSIAFARMSQLEFNEFFQAAIAAIPVLLPQFEGVDLEGELRTNSTGV